MVAPQSDLNLREEIPMTGGLVVTSDLTSPSRVIPVDDDVPLYSENWNPGVQNDAPQKGLKSVSQPRDSFVSNPSYRHIRVYNIDHQYRVV
jgi:hypothetical protein